MNRSGKLAGALVAALAGALLLSGPALADRGDHRGQHRAHKGQHYDKGQRYDKRHRADKGQRHVDKGHLHGRNWRHAKRHHREWHRKWHRAQRRWHRAQHRHDRWRWRHRHHGYHGKPKVVQKVVRHHYHYPDGRTKVVRKVIRHYPY